jgi:ABC-2 type transport system ATP-binding protein
MKITLKDGRKIMEPILEVRNLSKKYKDKKVLTNINMKVFKGDIYGFIGPNGAGKTTTIKTILGLLKPSKGEVYIEGENILKDKEINHSNIGAMIDYPSFYPNLSGYNNLMLYANILDLSNKRVKEVLELVRLTEDKNKKVSNYSMGMKQRLAVARAFLTKPKIAILDEPTNGLDPEGVKDMRDLIKDLAKDNNTTFIYCSHILNEVQNLCNRVAMINKGEIVIEDSMDNLLNTNKEEYSITTEEKNKLKEILSNVALKISDIEHGVSVEIKKGNFKLINKLIADNNIEITDVSKNSKSLEDYFIRALPLLIHEDKH